MLRRATTALSLLLLSAAALSWIAPSPRTVLSAAHHPQAWAGVHGADSAILTVAVAACWCVLGWLTLGILIGLLAELPGAAGWAARAVSGILLPRAMRQAVALVLGVGMVTAGASAAAADPGPDRPAAASAPAASPESAAAPETGGVGLDWPQESRPAPVPPPPTSPSTAGPVVIQPGDCLWTLAADRLEPGSSAGQIAVAVAGWYGANRATIGPDPDLILPGQQLIPPPAPRAAP